MKRVYILPNLFTAANLFLGMLAIIESIRASTDAGEFAAINACWFILAAAVMDALDGKVARVMKAESDFGLQFDSLADLISFGAAPAFLIYISFLQDLSNQHLAALATIVYVICGALRLARFNVQSGDEEKKSFTGLPIPAAACMVVSTFLLLRHYGDYKYLALMIKGLPILMIALALLMVSKISYPSFKNLPLEKAKSFQALFTIVLIGCLLYGLKDIKELIVFLLFLTYLAIGVYGEIYQVVTGRKADFVLALDQESSDNSIEQD